LPLVPREVGHTPTAATRFPDGITFIANQLAFKRQDGLVTDFNGHMPLFTHADTDIATFSHDHQPVLRHRGRAR
jgi:hypothetical protein